MMTWRLLLSLLCLLSLISCGPKNEKKYDLFFTANILSQLTPCGCPLNQFGGIDKLAGLLESAQRNTPSIFFVAGNSFFSTPILPADFRFFSALKAAIVYESLSLLSPAAVLIGHRDLALGLDFLKQLDRKKVLPLLSSNLLSPEGHFLFAPFRILELPNLKIGIIGLTGKLPAEIKGMPARDAKKVHQPLGATYKIKRDSPVRSARKAQKEVKKKGVRYVILLSDLEPEEESHVLSQNSGIDLVVSSSHLWPPERSMTLSQAAILRPSPRLKSVSRATLLLKGNGVKVSFEDIPLTPEIPSQPAIKKSILQAEVLTKLMQSEFKKAFDYRGDFAGSEKCGSCHQAQEKFWRKTAHARAAKALGGSKAEYDPDCFLCHNTGFFGLGFLPNVQCEACHGPGLLHVQNNKTTLAKITAEVCLRCHTQERFPGFKAEEKMKQVRCAPFFSQPQPTVPGNKF